MGKCRLLTVSTLRIDISFTCNLGITVAHSCLLHHRPFNNKYILNQSVHNKVADKLKEKRVFTGIYIHVYKSIAQALFM